MDHALEASGLVAETAARPLTDHDRRPAAGMALQVRQPARGLGATICDTERDQPTST